MISRFMFYLRRLHSRQYISMALARGAAAACCREIDSTDPLTWEFSAFSQNGEDGIIDYLSRKIKKPNRYFVEIGSSKGMENNTSWLGIARKYSGLWIEGNKAYSDLAAKIVSPLNLGIECMCLKVTPGNVNKIRENSLFLDPDVFSLDIDGNDYYVMKAIIESGFRPKICVVEYNSAFGPEKKSTITYRDDFDYTTAHSTGLYFGVSVNGWREFFALHGYQFVSVDSNGVNAFFINSSEFEKEFVDDIRGLDYQENFYHARKFRVPWKKQYEMIAHMEFAEVGRI